MACTDIPRLLVEKDAATPAEPRYGLFAAATLVEDMDPRAGNGVTYPTVCSPGVHTYPAVGCDDESPMKFSERSLAITSADAFAVYAAEECPPTGRGNPTRRAEALQRRLVMGERHAVEAAVYHGYAGASPYLRHPDTHQVVSGELSVVSALGVLEHWLASRGRSGTIHAPRWTASVLDDSGVVHRDGSRIRTLLGNSVAFGSGYSGQGPEGNEDGQVWFYATPQVTIRRSEIVEQQTFDTATNIPFDLVERVYVVDWPCAAAAARTNLDLIEDLIPEPPEDEEGS
jgi:hypothetical protein